MNSSRNILRFSGFKFQVSGFKFQVSGSRYWVPSVRFLHSLFFMLTLTLTACSDNDEAGGAVTAQPSLTRRVAVVLPMDYGLEAQWKQAVTLSQENLLGTPALQTSGRVRLELEWYDEEAVDCGAVARELAGRDDIVAVIGAKYSADAGQMADVLCKAQKPFMTIATTAELMRAYAATGSLWAMTENDITQCEMLLSRAYAYGARRVSLIADRESLYGNTFVEWFGFQAEELNMKVVGIYDYEPATLAALSRQAATDGADAVVCVPQSIDDIATIEQAFQQVGSTTRRLYSDTGYGPDVIERVGQWAEGIEGVAFGSDPESGFAVFFEQRTGLQPALGVPQVYDAVLMLSHALEQQVADGEAAEENLNHYLRRVADSGLHGASGLLTFDRKVYTNVLSSTYYHYQLYQGRYITLDYLTSTGSHRSDATLASWNWQADEDDMQNFYDSEGEFNAPAYPPLHDRWALLVAASSGWANYRHQADVLNMYQMLRQHGYADDHIVLIMEDDLALSAKNPHQGEIRVRLDGANIYHDVVVDYRASQLKPADVKAILCGEQSASLPEVIRADADDNVLVFWSGHGSPGRFEWLDDLHGFTTDMARETFAAMRDGGHYRKLLWLAETCYSGSVMQAAKGFPGIMAITAANPYETSKADIFSYDLGVWMSNRFTYTLQDCLSENPGISLRDLYYRLFINTVGSHVMVYNAAYYGNIFRQTMGEFFFI